MESEYMALSMAMRDLIPLKAAVSQIADGGYDLWTLLQLSKS
jgi:hypothetical protein